MEDVAIDRSMVQVAERRYDRKIKTCRIHDLLRDLAISEAKEYKFFESLTTMILLVQSSEFAESQSIPVLIST
ncbi:conserved hypothetical protein [Ricinus communis]|uniref:Uncharacterized protein n=1 Tax=Ricinus communis TaxID=3988 RepID=B9SGW2_RICCO|nr:conserved hypothetical protein [Ricinus communis]